MIPFGSAPSESVAEECIEQICKWNKHVNAVITLDPDAARMAARQADKASSQGKPLGLLHGVPVLVKDNIETAGIKTTYGSGFFRDHVPSSDATVIKRLRNAGAIIVGKVTRHEFAFGRSPVLSLPCGFSKEGMPIGVMLEAAPWGGVRVVPGGYGLSKGD